MLFIAIGVGFLVAAGVLRFAPDLLVVPPRGVVGALAAVAAVGTALADAAPTGLEPLDLVLRAALGALLVLAGSVVGRFAPLLAALFVAFVLLDAGSPAVALAGLALGVAMLGAVAGGRLPLTGAVAGGLVAQVALRLDWPLFAGASLLAGALACLVLLLPAVPRLPGRARRPVGVALGAVVLVGVVGVAGGLIAAVGVAGDVDAAVDSAQRGLDLLGEDAVAAEEALLVAADRFGAAEDRLDAPWALPARAVPFLAQQVRAVETMASAGGNLARVAADSVEEADIDGIRPVDGRIDLANLEALQAPLGRADAALASAWDRLVAVDSPWLVGPVADRRVELLERVEGAAGSAEVAAQAVEALPAMLGGEGTRRYLLLVQQPSEARGSGGLPGNWGEITATDGQLELTKFGRISDLIDGGTPEGQRKVDMPADFEALYGSSPILYKWQNVTFSPDFPAAAELARQLYPQSGGVEIDGVLSIDPSAVAALLGITGPVDLADGEQLTSDSAEAFLYFSQYLTVDDQDANEERIDLLGDAAERAWGRLTSGALPGPRALADALGPAVAGRHLQLSVFDVDAQMLLERIGMTGAVSPPLGDGAGVFTQNLGNNKIDSFLERRTTYEARWDPSTGSVEGTYAVELDNAAPNAGLANAIIGWGGVDDYEPRPADGENLSLVHVHTALEPVSVTLDGTERTSVTPRRTYGEWYVTTLLVRVPPGGRSSIEVGVKGAVPARAAYRFDTIGQPAINDDTAAVRLHLADGWVTDGVIGADDGNGAVITASQSLSMPMTIEVGAKGRSVTTGS